MLAFSRTDGAQQTLAVCNAAETPAEVILPWQGSAVKDALSGQRFLPENGTLFLPLAPREGLLLIETE
ncbi:MAG: alpha-glucosidase C-terminal domain-containing protein [Oscillospiraceae bacterium]|nr:alpha-glucosidase C-terminal domain-containing protein [Oscillospiraceae bacterium]